MRFNSANYLLQKGQRFQPPAKPIEPEMLALQSDFLEFRKYAFDRPTFPHQRAWESLLNTKQSNKDLLGIAGDKLLILAPRGSTKSTFLIEWVAYQIGWHAAHKVNLKVLWISYELKTARQKSQQIQRLLKTPKYLEVFPFIRPGENWARELWEIDFVAAGLSAISEPYTLACSGILGNVTGKRANLIVLDDLIKSPEDIENPDIREEMANNYADLIRPTLLPGGRIVCLGTRMRPDDIYCTEFIAEKQWRIVEQSAILTDEFGNESSYWEPNKPTEPGYPLKYLQELREDNPISFSYQFQNKVLPLKTIAISPEHIKRGLLPESLDYLVLGVDLSAGERESNDYTAMVLGGYKIDIKTQIPQFYIIDAWEYRSMGNLAKLDAIFELYDAWKHLNEYLDIWVETNAYQLSFKGDYETYVLGKRSQYNWRITECPSKRSKLSRLRGVTGLFENNLVTFNVYGSFLGKLIEQLTLFGSTPHDDLCDACVLTLNGLRDRKQLTYS